MTLRGSGERRVIARGQIRVDARRAIAKLREHLLVDLHLYAREIVRSAIAAGATAIDVHYDADDVTFTFDGEPIAEATLPRLLDHVIGDATTAEARRLRTLALGLNAALGLRPAFIDTIVVGGREPRQAVRMRWTPAMLEAGEESGADTRPACECIAEPPGMPARGMRVHLKRRVGWNVLRRAVAGDLPPEISLLAEAVHDAQAVLTLSGRAFPHAPRPAALLRVPFSESGLRRAFLEILPAGSGPPQIDFLEQGVLLIRKRYNSAPAFPDEPFASLELPVRVIADAPVLPTNASRSALREDASLPGRISEAAAHAFRDALSALQSLVLGQGEVPAGVQVVDRDPQKLEDALGNLACIVAGAVDRGVAVTDEARALLKIPLLRDAVGRPLAPLALLCRDRKAPLYVWTGKTALPEDIGHWMRDVIWLRGRTAEKLVAFFHVADAAQILDQARAGLERRKALLAHPPTDPVVPPAPRQLVREAFHVQGGPFAGLRGEVAVRMPSKREPGAVFRIFVESRHLHSIEVDPSKIPLPLDAALSWEGHIRPTYRYDGVEQDHILRLALWYAVRVGILAVDGLGERILKATDCDARLAELAPLFRLAAGARVVSSAGLGIDAPADPPLMTYASIWNAKVWPTTEPDRPVSLSEISLYAHRTGVICTAPPQSTGVAPDRRPVVMLAPLELQWIQAVCPLAVTIPYAQALARPQDHEDRRRMALRMAMGKLRTCPVMAFTRPGVWGRIACSAEPRVTFLHAGRVLKAQTAPAELGPVAIVADDTTLVPGPEFRDIRWQSPPDWLNDVGSEFLQQIVAAAEGDPAAWDLLTALDREPAGSAGAAPALPAILDGPDGRLVRAYLIGAATSTPDTALKARIEKLPIVSVLDERGEEKATSLSEVAAMHPAPKRIPVLRHIPGFETLDWGPVIAKDFAELAALEHWSRFRTSLAEEEISARREAARIERERREFLQKPLLDLHAVGELADADAHVMFYMIMDGPPGAPPPSASPDEDITLATAMPHLKIAFGRAAGRLRDMCVAVALPRRGLEISFPLVDVLLDGRFLCQVSLPLLKLPVVARVGLTSEEHVIPWHGLTSDGLMALSAGVHDAAHALALELLELQSSSSAPEPFHTNIRLLRVIRDLLQEPVPPGSTAGTGPLAVRLFSDTMLWPTVQGEEHPWSKLKQAAYGRTRYSVWHRAKGRAEMDRPIFYLPSSPEGSLLESILAQTGIHLRDESHLLEKLQAARVAKAPAQSPRLSGDPPHPVLRIDLAAAGIRAAAGEMEIVQGPASEVSLIGIDGIERPVKAELPIPLRVVARGEFLDLSEASIRPALLDIAKAARSHLVGRVANEVQELPDFVRGHLRHIVCKSAGSQSKKMSKQHRQWEVIPDITGRYHSLAELQAEPDAKWVYTTDAPPYPKHDPGQPVLHLTEKEANALSSRLELKNLTAVMRRRREAEERAAAPQLGAIVLTAEQRARCVRVVPLSGDGITGEAGILAPEHARSRGIIVHTTRRPLCQITEMPGWPILAVVNDDRIRPNQAFNAIRKIAQKEALKARVRTAAEQALDEWLAPPPDALAVRRMHGIKWPESPLIEVAGTFFLPAVFPEQPVVRTRVPKHGEPRSLPLSVQAQAPSFSDVVPVGGDILVRAVSAKTDLEETAQDTESEPNVRTTKHMQALAAMALHEAAILVADALKEGSSPLLLAYQWNLRLLGAREAGEPTAPTTEQARRVNADDVLLELSLRGQLWFTRRAGDIEGKFPDTPPGFILLDDGASPLLAVLRCRAPGALCELGGDNADTEPPASLDAPGAVPLSPPNPIDIEAAPETAQDRSAEPPPEPPAGWFSGLVRRVTDVVAAFAPEPEPPVPAELRAVLLNAIDELRLTSRAVASVEYTRSGRPVRFDRENSRLLLNRKHPAIQVLIPRAHRDPRALTLLLCAAVGEINRGLDIVTDADERRALIDLLRAEPSLGTSAS